MSEVIDRKILKAISTETRQEIIKILSKRPYTASELSKIMNKHVTTLSEHLEILEQAGLVQKKESTNRWVYYQLSSKGEKLFQPKYFTWVIVFSLSLIAFVGSLGSLFFQEYSTKAESMPLGETAAPLAQRAADTAPPDVSVVAAVILVSAAIVGMVYSSYRIRKAKSVKIKLK